MILLDANIVIKVARRKSKPCELKFADAVDRNERLAIPSIVLHELLVGVHGSSNPESAAHRLDAILSHISAILPFDKEDADLAAELSVGLARRGFVIGPYDLLIAAQTLRRNALLVTNNVSEFSRVPGLKWTDWTEPA